MVEKTLSGMDSVDLQAEQDITHAKPMTRLELLEKVNQLNMLGSEYGERYWTCTVLYNTVIWKQLSPRESEMHEVISGIPE